MSLRHDDHDDDFQDFHDDDFHDFHDDYDDEYALKGFLPCMDMVWLRMTCPSVMMMIFMMIMII